MFCNRLKKARKEAKLTQGELASRVGLTAGAISQMESGLTKQPSASNLLPLAKALHVHPQWLISGKGDKYDLSLVQQRIVEAMGVAHMMPFDLTDETGGLLAPETVEQWITARAEPSDAQLRLIAEPLGRTFDWLKFGISTVNELPGERVVYDATGQRDELGTLSPLEIDVVRCMRDMGSDRRDCLHAIARDSAHAARDEAEAMKKTRRA